MTQFALLPDAPMKTDRFPVGPIVRDALVDGNYRRWLKRAWGPGPCVGWAMLNPSGADGLKDDPTMAQVIGRSFRLGFGSCVVGNYVPFISSSPAAMRQWLTTIDEDPSAREALIRNAYDCAGLFASCQMMIAAWGNGADRDRLGDWIEVMELELGRKIEWYCLGTNADGSPKHPLARGVHRIAVDFQPVRWAP